ncbi:MAG: tetratricopeptide repeat protein, partial [Mariprofundaceae bacterium]|nr:tetratricopeptide repeat protein [Mariprofundaceae bacterium]
AKIHFQLGINALYSGDLPKAFEELMRSNKILPKQPEVLDSLAYAWRVRGDNVKAEALYRQSLAIRSRASTETNYGNLLVALKRYSEAEVHLRIALQDPRYQKQYITLINLGDALLGQHRFNSAIQAYRQASTLNPLQNISKLHEADAYVQAQRFNDAQALYESMLNKDPNNRPALEGLIAILVKQHQIRTARQYMARYIEKEKEPLNRAWANDELIRLGQML